MRFEQAVNNPTDATSFKTLRTLRRLFIALDLPTSTLGTEYDVLAVSNNIPPDVVLSADHPFRDRGPPLVRDLIPD